MVGQIGSLLRIPGVGPSIAADLNRLGIQDTAELRGRNPESLYADLCRVVGRHVDRCVLYVFRCAVYYASEAKHDPELLKWWNWKDAIPPRPRSRRAPALPSPGPTGSRSDSVHKRAKGKYPPGGRSPARTPQSRGETRATP
jgi:hypothetical protein